MPIDIARTLLLVLASTGAAPGDPPAPARGPLVVHPTNPRYFTDGSGRAVLLVGSHTWDNLQEWIDPRTGSAKEAERAPGGSRRSFQAPGGEGWVLRLRA